MDKIEKITPYTVKLIIRVIFFPILLPVFLIYGHIRWATSNDIPYSWVWLVPFHDYLLNKEP